MPLQDSLKYSFPTDVWFPITIAQSTVLNYMFVSGKEQGTPCSYELLKTFKTKLKLHLCARLNQNKSWLERAPVLGYFPLDKAIGTLRKIEY